MANSNFDLYFDVIQTLEKLGIDYVIIGAFAGTSYDITRTTYDVDIVVHLQDHQIEPLAAVYLSPRFYADPEQMRSSIHWGMMFNIIDSTAGDKVDLIPLTMKPGYEFALAARIRRNIRTASGATFPAGFARPEDMIVGKLMAWREGGSAKHETDIRDMLIAVRLGEDAEISAMFDFAYVDEWAQSLGENVEQIWQHLKAITQAEVDEQT
jgi:hypothetical protein